MIYTHVGQIYLATPVLSEINEIDEGACVELGIILVEPELEQVMLAAEKKGALSFQDNLCLILAKEHGWTCVTNDKPLRQKCEIKKPFDGPPQPQVIQGPDIRPAQGKNEKHLRGPFPDPLHAGETADNLVVFEPFKLRQDDLPRDHLLGQIPDINDFLPGQPGAYQSFFVKGQHGFRCGPAAGLDGPVPDAFCRFDGKLLPHNGPQQGREVVSPQGEGVLADEVR